MKNISFLPFILIFALASCAYTTQSEVTFAERYLKGNCKEAYLSTKTAVSSDGFGYQYHRYKVRAFAVANYGDTQVCAWWSGGFSQIHANSMAINSCNQRLSRGLTCVVYAEGDRILNVPPNYPTVTQITPKNITIEGKPNHAPNFDPEKLNYDSQNPQRRQPPN